LSSRCAEPVDDEVEDPGRPGLAAVFRIDPPQHAELQQDILGVEALLELACCGALVEQDGDRPDEGLVVLVVTGRRVDDLGGSVLELPVAGDLAEPEPEGLQWRVRFQECGREVDEVLDVVPVQLDDERLPAGEMPVERADADAGLPGDRAEGCAARGGEGRTGGGQDALAVGAGVFPGRRVVCGWRDGRSVRSNRGEACKTEGSPVRWLRSGGASVSL
jgi:hypothetical protein